MLQNNRLLPDFIVIGAMKCGTTTLYRHLEKHPRIGMSRDKETDFFVAEKNYSEGIDWYSNQFDRKFELHGEASPNYTKNRDFPGVPRRIRETCPDAKLIYIVRDPVVRAESQFRHSWIMGSISDQPEELHGTHEYHHIMDASHYARQLEAYLEVFPREQILVLDFDDLVQSPQKVMDETCAFIGVEPFEIEDAGAQNDSSELSKVPAPVLRFAQSSVGRSIAGLASRDMRNRVRGLLARGPSRKPASFPADLKEKMQAELAADAGEFRKATGLGFASWSI